MDIKRNQESGDFSKEEVQKRFEAALRGARSVGHKPQSEMKLGKSKRKRKKIVRRKNDYGWRDLRRAPPPNTKLIVRITIQQTNQPPNGGMNSILSASQPCRLFSPATAQPKISSKRTKTPMASRSAHIMASPIEFSSPYPRALIRARLRSPSVTATQCRTRLGNCSVKLIRALRLHGPLRRGLLGLSVAVGRMAISLLD